MNPHPFVIDNGRSLRGLRPSRLRRRDSPGPANGGPARHGCAAIGLGGPGRYPRKIALRCAVYTRVSTDSGLEQDFNSLDNQREASEAYIKSQAHVGWKLVRERYDDGGFSGGSMARPAR